MNFLGSQKAQLETNSWDVVIVTCGSVSSGPRVEKEADALSSAGFSVEVVAVHTQEWMTAWDTALARSKPWALTATRRETAIGWEAATWFVSSLASKAARKFRIFPEIAASSAYLPLVRATSSKRARLYIAHNLAALPVAASLAARNQSLFAFDAEDDHFGELSKEKQNSFAGVIVRSLESKYLPKCAYVTASSEGIADAIRTRVGIARPAIVHNVFPWSLRSAMDGQTRDRRGNALSLYWFSQTIGQDRGLETLFKAARKLKGDFQIHLRGSMSTDVEREMQALVTANGLRGRVSFHPQVPPWELLSRTAEHDVGLALELPVTDARNLCVTNKFFVYLLCGMAVVATATRGQERILSGIADAGEICPVGDEAALARILQNYIDNPGALRRARECALKAARDRWNWENERRVLVDVVSRALSCARETQRHGSGAV